MGCKGSTALFSESPLTTPDLPWRVNSMTFVLEEKLFLSKFKTDGEQLVWAWVVVEVSLYLNHCSGIVEKDI